MKTPALLAERRFRMDSPTVYETDLCRCLRRMYIDFKRNAIVGQFIVPVLVGPAMLAIYIRDGGYQDHGDYLRLCGFSVLVLSPDDIDSADLSDAKTVLPDWKSRYASAMSRAEILRIRCPSGGETSSLFGLEITQ